MTLEETSKIVAIFTLSGVKFDGPKKEIVTLWYECLKDLEFKFVLKGAKRLIKSETELFANGLIAKVRQEAKFIKENEEIQKQNELDRKKEMLQIEKTAALIEGVKK